MKKEKEVCPKCDGTGWILRFDNMGRTIASECSCRGRMIAESRLKRSGMQEIFQNKKLETYECKQKLQFVAKQKAMEYIEKFENLERTDHNSLLFLGQVGSGKTHLSLAVGNELLTEHDVSVVYMPYRETISNLRSWEFKDKQMFDEEMHKLSFARLLIIDDLYKGKIDERDLNFVFQIVNQRYLNHLPIICSSEKTNLELMDIDEAIGSRLIEMSRGHAVQFVGQELNHRLEK